MENEIMLHKSFFFPPRNQDVHEEGWSSWTPRLPRRTSQDLLAVLEDFKLAWNKKELILVYKKRFNNGTQVVSFHKEQKFAEDPWMNALSTMLKRAPK